MAMQSQPATGVSTKCHTRRRMTEQEKIEYRRRRLLRACAACASSKRKCNHIRLDRRPVPGSNPDSAFEDPSGETASLVIRPRTPVEQSNRTHSHAGVRTVGFSWHKNRRPAPRSHKDYDKPGDDNVLDSCLADTLRLNLHKPQSAENLSVMLFAENVEWAGVADSWFGGAPARLGHDSCYDLAIEALMMVCWYGRNLPGATLVKVYCAMGASLTLLHAEMSKEGAVLNDHILATVAALSPVDAITSGTSLLVSSHLDGVASILASQAAVIPLSSVARGILQYHFCDSYVMATLRGTFSPFEAMDQLYCEYNDLSKAAAERRIRAIGNKLCVRLPRLIMLVRLACGVYTSGTTVLSAINLAVELLQFQDEVAETEFLDAVGVAFTKLPRDRRVIEYSLDFKGLSSLEAGSYYWHSRSTLLQLCSRLRSYFPKICDMYALPSLLEIQGELQRFASNIVMSVPYARTNTARKRRRLLGQSLLACWSTFKDFQVVFTNEGDIDETRCWLLESLNIALLGKPVSLEAHDLDEAAELFRGGALVGRYKYLYDPPESSTGPMV